MTADVQPAQAVEFIALGFHDCSLSFRVGIGQGGIPQVRESLRAAGPYNAFDPDAVANALEAVYPRLASLEFGRENSPVLYATVPFWTHQTYGWAGSGQGEILPEEVRAVTAHMFLAAMEHAQADELSFEAHGGDDRMWYRGAMTEPEQVYRLRAWWD